ncbi:hypothetical protein [Commensalibacter nepenthis]|uniref:DUF945 domain-containing protein n=1 Tax=Commensalibacter nepenthis TaxID=3043872 RepID=A0ABT6Q4X7_9PROT|nr:hypothetical protein [Commensalibacter sp. TBRC 10068]MDI2111954.1 hypothetical protein [Commensalibacter sp. TBRC 10068]
MSKVAVIGAVVVIGVGVVGGGGYYYVSQRAEKKFQEKIELIKSTFPGLTIAYADHNIGVFSQEVTMDKVVVKYIDGKVYTADKVSATMSSDNEIKNLTIDKLAVKEKEGSSEAPLTIEHTEIANAKADAGWIVIENGKIKKIVPSKINFGLLNLQNLEFKPDSRTHFKIAHYQMKNYGLGQKTDIVLEDLSDKNRNNFSIRSFKMDQVNLADISKKQEEFVSDKNNQRSSDAGNKALVQNLSMVQFDLLNIDDLQFKDKYGSAFKIAHYQTKNYGLDKKTDILLQDLLVKDSNDTVSIGAFKIDQINLANMLKTQSEFATDKDYSKSTSEKIKEYIQLISEMQFNLFSIDNLQIEEYKFVFKLAQYQMKDYGMNRKTSQSIKDFSVVIPYFNKISLSLASYETSGVDVAVLVSMLKNLDFNNPNTFSKDIAGLQKEYIQKVGGIQSEGKVSGLKFSMGHDFISLGALTIHSDVSKEGSSNGTYALDGLEFSIPNTSYNELLQALKRIGYQKVSVSGNLNMQYQMDTNVLSASLKDLTFKDIGKINATLQANMPLYISYNSPEIMLTNPNVKLKEFSVILQNHGVVERLLKSASQEQVKTETELKEELVTSVKETMQKQKEIPAAFAQDTVKTLEVFLQNPQTTEIKLSSTPVTPISGANFKEKTPAEQFDLLNLKIQAVPVKH